MLGKTAERHTSAEFVAHHPPPREIHMILDNLSAHKTKLVEAFLRDHPTVRLHFTPTYASWLKQVARWFAKIERDVIARGLFTSRQDPTRTLMRSVRHYNRNAKPVKWKYTSPAYRITSTLPVTDH